MKIEFVKPSCFSQWFVAGSVVGKDNQGRDLQQLTERIVAIWRFRIVLPSKKLVLFNG